jgi:phasin family protein
MTTVNDTMSTVNEMTNKGFERMTSLSELNLRVFERLAARQMDAVNLFMEHGIRVMKLATESKGYNELVKGQVEAAKELSERLMSESKTNISLAGEVRDDYRHWFEKNLAEVSADLRKGAPTAA